MKEKKKAPTSTTVTVLPSGTYRISNLSSKLLAKARKESLPHEWEAEFCARI
jgi:hypothetical protein